MDHNQIRKGYYNKLADEPLEPDDELYVPLYEGSADHILSIKGAINFSLGGQSVHLLSGYRGSGKSTQLKRLRNLLKADDCFVAFIDIEDHLDLHIPLDITDFLLALCGALGLALEAEDMLGKNPAEESPWGRFSNWLQSKVELTGVSVEGSAGITKVGLQAEIRSNPTFRQRVQERLSNHLGAFNAEVREFVAASVKALNEKRAVANKPHAPLVIIVDSLEHARGTRTTESEIHRSLERLFSQHEDKLKLPGVHIVYTVPPWLRIRYPGIGGLYDGSYRLQDQHVHHYPDPTDVEPIPYRPGLDLLRRVVEKRVDPTVLFDSNSKTDLEGLLLISGGHLRDLIRLLRTTVLMARELPAKATDIQAAIENIRADFLPISDEDARWLAKIARTHEVKLETNDKIGDLARFFDTHLVLCYFEGREWYDVHPLVRDIILKQVEGLEAPEAP